MSELRFVMGPDHAPGGSGRRTVRWTSLNGHPGECRCWHADPEEALACYRGATRCTCACSACTLARAGLAGGGHCGQGSCPVRPAAA